MSRRHYNDSYVDYIFVYYVCRCFITELRLSLGSTVTCGHCAHICDAGLIALFFSLNFYGHVPGKRDRLMGNIAVEWSPGTTESNAARTRMTENNESR